jgi:hypothetical protein
MQQPASDRSGIGNLESGGIRRVQPAKPAAARSPAALGHRPARTRTPGRLAATALAAVLLGACSATIVPPSSPVEPVGVVVLDHGRHSSLVLPDAADGALRYSYGDWDYYVMRRTDLGTGVRALLRPTSAALGREALPVAPESERLPGLLKVPVVERLAIDVERARVTALRETLERRFEAAIDTKVYSPWFGLEFVRDPKPYTLDHNSNRMVADWLTALGCTIRGQPTLSGWRLAAPGAN